MMGGLHISVECSKEFPLTDLELFLRTQQFQQVVHFCSRLDAKGVANEQITVEVLDTGI